jgi:hypothetical protein
MSPHPLGLLRVDALWKGRKMEEKARIALEKSIREKKEELEFLKSLRPKEKNRPMTVVEELTEKLRTSESEIERLRKKVAEEYDLGIKWQRTADYWYNKAKEAQEVLGREYQRVAEIWNKKQKD